MKDIITTISLLPIIVSVVLLVYVLINKKTSILVYVLLGLMIFAGIAFTFFIKYLFRWDSGTSEADIIASSMGVIFPFLILISASGKKESSFSVRNIYANIQNHSFFTLGLLLFIGLINVIMLIAYVVRFYIN